MKKIQLCKKGISMKKLLCCLLLLCPLAQAETKTQPTPETKVETCYKAGMALEILTQCADKGDADAQNILGMMYLQGQGITKDEKKAFQLFTKAAAQNQGDAQNALGVIYEKGYGVLVDTNKAFEWYSKAAQLNHVGAQNNLAYMYAYGTGVKQDIVVAYMWATLAVIQGYTETSKLRDLLITSMNTEQKERGKLMVDEWFAKHEKK
jgi:uncharacterized protein